MKTPLNGAALTCVVPRLPAGIANYSKSGDKMLPIIRLGVVGEILSRPLIWLLGMTISMLVLISLDSPMHIVKFIPFLYCPFYIDYSVMHVFI